MSLEQRIEKLEAQMQKRIERYALLSDLLYQQVKLQSIILHYLKTRETLLGYDPLFAPLLEQQLAQYDQMLSELALEDTVAREYIHSLKDLLEP